MIYCVAFEVVRSHLASLGFRIVAETERTLIFGREDETFTLLKPNQNGDLPEALVNDAFDSAGLSVPKWDVHWCD